MKRFFLGFIGALLTLWGVHYAHRIAYGSAADSATNWAQTVGMILSGALLIIGPQLSPAARLVLTFLQGRIVSWAQDKEPVDDLIWLRQMRRKHPEQADAIRRLTLAAMEKGAPAAPGGNP